MELARRLSLFVAVLLTGAGLFFALRPLPYDCGWAVVEAWPELGDEPGVAGTGLTPERAAWHRARQCGDEGRDALAGAGPWVLAAVLVAGAGWFVFRDQAAR